MVDKQQQVMYDRTNQEQELLDKVVNSLSTIDLFSEMIELFGWRRTVELIGWSARWDMAGIDNISEIRRRYEEIGASRSAAYRAASDCKQIGDRLLVKYGRDVEMKEILKALANGIPYMG